METKTKLQKKRKLGFRWVTITGGVKIYLSRNAENKLQWNYNLHLWPFTFTVSLHTLKIVSTSVKPWIALIKL